MPLLLYDFLAARGGAERVLQVMHDEFGGEVVVGFVNRAVFSNAETELEGLFNLNCHQRFSLLKILTVCHAFSRLNLSRWKSATKIFSGSYSVLAATESDRSRNVYYCHTPPRFLYDLKDHYLQECPLSLRPALALFSAWLRPQYEEAVRKMGIVVANSMNVRNRLNRFLNISSTVIHPPVDTARYAWKESAGYYLSTARLEPLKRVDILIKAFLEMPDKRLIVASGGSELPALQRLAAGAPNIQFTGWISAEKSVDLVSQAIATLYIAKDEDFGMSPVESMAAGKPVFGVAEGGLTETVIDRETGFLLPPLLDHSDVRAAVMAHDPLVLARMRSACEERARAFDRKVFVAAMQGIL